MKTVDVNTTIVDGYLKLLESLSPNNKLDLISKLSDSIKSDLGKEKKFFKKAFGAFQSAKEAEQIISETRGNKAQ